MVFVTGNFQVPTTREALITQLMSDLLKTGQTYEEFCVQCSPDARAQMPSRDAYQDAKSKGPKGFYKTL
jgi:hypothetical protein